MENKNVDIFKIVEEVNKRDTNKDINDIYSMLDDVKDIKVDEVKEKVSSMNDEVDALKSKRVNGSSTVIRPNLPELDKDYTSRYMCFVDLIRKVDYGSSNSNEYVKGHRASLNKYLKEANNNKADLYLVEASCNDEITTNATNNSIFDKGYSDGLNYVYKALKKSRAIMLEKIYQEIKSNL